MKIIQNHKFILSGGSNSKSHYKLSVFSDLLEIKIVRRNPHSKFSINRQPKTRKNSSLFIQAIIRVLKTAQTGWHPFIPHWQTQQAGCIDAFIAADYDKAEMSLLSRQSWQFRLQLSKLFFPVFFKRQCLFCSSNFVCLNLFEITLHVQGIHHLLILSVSNFVAKMKCIWFIWNFLGRF